MGLSRKLVTNIKRHRLDRVAKALGINFEGHHRAINDAEVTAKIFLVFCDTLKSLKDKFDGQRCFLIGNGPSLSAEDLEKVRGEYSFSCNKIYKAFDKTNFRPCFYIVDDYALVKEDYENIIKVPSKETFVCLEYGKKLLKK
mgnify:CR=1 FL=1